eukprot:5510277-Pyramimonas_sp.AAC.1
MGPHVRLLRRKARRFGSGSPLGAVLRLSGAALGPSLGRLGPSWAFWGVVERRKLEKWRATKK